MINGNGKHGVAVDIWSLGVIMYAMLVGTPPFQADAMKKIYKRIQTNDYSYPPEVEVSDTAKDLITRILQLNPDDRPALSDVRKHPFFQGVNLQALPDSAGSPPTLAAQPLSQHVAGIQDVVSANVFQAPANGLAFSHPPPAPSAAVSTTTTTTTTTLAASASNAAAAVVPLMEKLTLNTAAAKQTTPTKTAAAATTTTTAPAPADKENRPQSNAPEELGILSTR